ncbi:LamG domain-containing protein [Leptothrix discophora]|uniref:LamG domain-containing protein n=1 Tax=Leptothrix discophora TaxID=89 RepID=A0ABT9G7Y8_LEPDI|nr:LamG domain-containing protein [Leptothrix discophora]MDP4302594.1 LamG domain-containing protein [Leptothrix discophora]
MAAAWRHRLSAFLLQGLLLAGLCLASTAQAATYSYRSDSYAWESASQPVSWSGGCSIYPGDDDRATLNFTNGFTFTFAGTAYNSVRVLSNGGLQFGADTGFYRTYNNTTFPIGKPATLGGGCPATDTTRVLMAYWADLDPSRSGSVTWEQKGSAPNRQVVVSWNNVHQYNTSTPYTFQIILFENGEFKFQYGNANASGSNATIGVQVDPNDHTQYSFNSGYNANGTAIRWYRPSGEPARVAEYRFDEVIAWSGAIGEVRDSSGNRNNGLRVGSASVQDDGRLCRRADIPLNTGTTISAVDTSLDVDTAIGSRGTLSFWFRSNTAWASGTPGMLMSATTSSGRPFHLQRTATGTLQFVVSDSSGTTLTATSPVMLIPAGTWTHIAATWAMLPGTNNTQSTVRLYINGVQSAVASNRTNGELDASLASLYVGDNRSSAAPSNTTFNSANGQFDELRISNYEMGVAEIALDLVPIHACTPPLHHIELRHATGTGLTCSPENITVVACEDAACRMPSTAGASGQLSSTHAATLWPQGQTFTIPAGQSSVDVPLQLPVAGATTLGVSTVLPSASNNATCNFGSPACTWTSADVGLQVNASDHVAGIDTPLTVRAVRKADNANVCVAALANTVRPLLARCRYANPSGGTQPLLVNGTPLNAAASASSACDGSGASVNLAFDAQGIATTTLRYADAGQVELLLGLTGPAGDALAAAGLSGATTFIAVPAVLAIDNLPAGPIAAGAPFSVRLRALNALGSVMPSFGKESPPASVTLSHTRAAPTGSGAVDGIFSTGPASFTNGEASVANLSWSEVGRIDLAATLSNYLGSGLGALGSTGTAGAIGRFVPKRLALTATPACGSWSYAGQPFAVTLQALNAAGAVTRNYDGSGLTTPTLAQRVSLSEVGGLGGGGLVNGVIAASSFRAGVASLSGSGAPAYAYTDKLTAPRSVVLRGSDADGVSSAPVGGVGSDPGMALRSGRLRLSNAFGTDTQALDLALQLEYWSGRSWVPASDDTCTVLPLAAVARGTPRSHRGGNTNWTAAVQSITLGGGTGKLRLAPPSPKGTGTVDVAINLGHSTSDASCVAGPGGAFGAIGSSTGAGLPWLRSRTGACSTAFDRDPSARASFGVYSPESRQTLMVREVD